jgi:hypothetical protein
MRLFFILFIFFQISSFGQGVSEELKRQVFGNPEDLYNQNYIRSINEIENKPINEQYIFENWVNGIVTDNLGVEFKIDSINILIDNSNIVFANDENYYSIDNHVCKYLTIGDRVFRPYYIVKNDGHPEYKVLERLSGDGDLQLVLESTLKEIKQYNNPLGTGSNNFDLVKSSKLKYYDARNQTLNKIPKRKKSFLRIFYKKRNKVSSFCNQNNISLKSKGDLIQVFDFHNNLK